MQIEIPFMRLDRQFAAVRDAVMPAVLGVLERGRVLQSPEIEQLENRLARMHKVDHCVVVNSGTDALIFSIASLGLREGSRIAVPAMSFVASASAVLHNRCRPVFVDINPDTMLMDQITLLELIRHREIEAIVAVHLYGQMLDLDEVANEARRQNIALIEDAAQALGSTRLGHPPGFYGDVTCLSFDPTKVIGAYGSGGAILTNRHSVSQFTRQLRYHGHVGKHIYECPGFNSQMDSVQAAIIAVKLDYLDQWQTRRIQIAARYAQGLADTPHVRQLKTLPGSVHNFHKFVVSVPSREDLQRYLASKGIQTAIHYLIPLHLQPCFTEQSVPASFPNVEQAAKTILSLPMYAELTDEEINYIVASILEYYGARSQSISL